MPTNPYCENCNGSGQWWDIVEQQYHRCDCAAIPGRQAKNIADNIVRSLESARNWGDGWADACYGVELAFGKLTHKVYEEQLARAKCDAELRALKQTAAHVPITPEPSPPLCSHCKDTGEIERTSGPSQYTSWMECCWHCPKGEQKARERRSKLDQSSGG